MLGYIVTEQPGQPTSYLLTIDGVPLARAQAWVLKSDNELGAHVYDAKLYERIIRFSTHEVLQDFASLSVHYPFAWSSDFTGFYIYDVRVSRAEDGTFKLLIDLAFDIDAWRHPWTMVEHITEFKLLFDAQSTADMGWHHWSENDRLSSNLVFFNIKNPDATIQSELEQPLSILNAVHQQTVVNLLSKVQQHAVVVPFNFPDEVKVACGQYLLYFIQFLRDVGIEATAELKEEAGTVLFSVTPKDKDEALENIRTALAMYLRLPAHPSLSVSASLGADIEVQRLVSNIYHLQGQLALAGAIIQQKDILIQQQTSFIEQQLLSGHVLVQSIQEEQEDKESLVGDIVAVKKYDWEFLELDLPTLLRRLKQRFKRNNPE